MWGLSKKTASYGAESRLSPKTKSASALILDLLIPQIVRNKFLLFVRHPVYGNLLGQPKQSSTAFVYLKYTFQGLLPAQDWVQEAY